MEKFFTTDVFSLLLIPGAFVVVYSLFSVAQRDITRAGVMFWGLFLIVVAGYIGYSLNSWEAIGNDIVKGKHPVHTLSEGTLKAFHDKAAFLLWFIPFVTGALGTNLISDALRNHQGYNKPSSQCAAAVAVTWIAKKLFWGLLWLLVMTLELLWPIISVWSWARRWRTGARLSRRAYLRRHAIAKQPWQR